MQSQEITRYQCFYFRKIIVTRDDGEIDMHLTRAKQCDIVGEQWTARGLRRPMRLVTPKTGQMSHTQPYTRVLEYYARSGHDIFIQGVACHEVRFGGMRLVTICGERSDLDVMIW